MRVNSRQTFVFTFTSEHVQLVLNGLSELPYKDVNGLIRYIQQQMTTQLEQAEQAHQRNVEQMQQAEEEVEEEDEPEKEPHTGSGI